MLLQRGDLKQSQGEGGGEEQPVGGGKVEERSTAASHLRLVLAVLGSEGGPEPSALFVAVT